MSLRSLLSYLAPWRHSERKSHRSHVRGQAPKHADDHNAALQRISRYESFEERLALSAEPVAKPWCEPLDPLTEPQSVTIAPQSIATGDKYGLDYVRQTYGFLGAGQTVAIIDSGIAYDHPALGGGLGANYRVVGGWDFAENDADPYDDAPGGFHGTHVAGILASSDATYRGVAPAVDLVALRVFDDQGYGEISWVEQALRWVHEHRNAFENPITVVNLSLGANSKGDSASLGAQIEDELALLKADGILVVASAGNSFATEQTVGLTYPAASPNVVPVASVGPEGQLSSFSQRDPRVLAAPGERITSTVPDFAKNLDGVTNDFEHSSGTSMATPFVAGAAVLVREAMEAAGRTNITGEMIYEHLRKTADLVFDPITNASYHRIHIGRAIDAVMPADDYGSTVADAHPLGSLSGQRTLTGVLGHRQDIDYFQFTASQTGAVHFRATPSGNLTTEWRLADGSVRNGATLAMEVVAGRTYTVGVAAQAGVGSYTIGIEVKASTPPVDWGAVAFQTYADQRIEGEAWRTFRASRKGILTVEAFFAHAAGDVNLELYDGDRLIASSRGRTDGERLDVAVTAGQALSLRIVGHNPDVDVRLTNLVTVTGKVLDVAGTAGNDHFAFSTGARHVIEVNGVQYTYATEEIATVRVQGGAGRDTLSLTGTRGQERLTARPGQASFVGAGWTVTAANVESLDVKGGGGRDEATLHGSLGNDRYTGGAGEAHLDGDQYAIHAVGFTQVLVDGGAGHDTAFLVDSAGDDLLETRPGEATLSGGGFRQEVRGFESVRASASSGFDRAIMHDSADGDRFFARPEMAWITGRDFLSYASGFDVVEAVASNGGHDMAWLFDSRRDDYLGARLGKVWLTGEGIELVATGFETVRATASAGGYDRAEFFRSQGDQFSASYREAIHSGQGYFNFATNFAQVDQTPSAVVRQAVFQGLDQEEDEQPSSLTPPNDMALQALGAVFDELGA